jgi:hypothetical protein
VKLWRATFVGVAGALCAALALGAAKPRTQTQTQPPPPPPQVDLALVANAPDHDWIVKLTNTGTIPVRIVADPRLLSFDVTNAAHTAHCTLPSDMVPSTDTARTLVVPPQRSWSAHVDPVLYCYSAADIASLVVGASVTASFGFLAPRYVPPFAITPTIGDAGVFAARRVTAQPVMLAAAPTPADAGASAVVPEGGTTMIQNANEYPAMLKTSLPARLDVSRAFEQSVNIMIVNEGDRAVRTLITPPTLGFFVELPSGRTVRCGGESSVTAIAELVTTLAPRARTATSIDLGAVCGAEMRTMGIYRVRPRLDTRHATPPPGSASFWQGESIGAPMLVRIREGEEPLPTPHLDPLPP